jgi:putative transposase
MARTARFLKDGVCYYIQSRGSGNQKIFREGPDYARYVCLLRKYKLRFRVGIYGYCLMPAAVHLVAHPADARDLPLFMQGIHQSYALFFNGRYKRKGKVWGQRYQSVLINRNGGLFECVKSVEFIPVKAKQSRSPVEYPWSSCSFRVLGSNGIIDTMPPADSMQ